MSEELIKNKYLKTGPIGQYMCYNVGDSTLNQLKRNKIVPNKDYGAYSQKKPDGLIIDDSNKKHPKVIAVIEFKTPDEFRTDRQKKAAVQQCNNYCNILDADVGIITDGNETIWINPKHRDDKNKYYDDEVNIERSYSIILNEDKKPLSEPFIITSNSANIGELDEDTRNTLDYLNRCKESLSDSNSVLIKSDEVDPLNLAKSVWQDIYVNTGKDPTKCLYNVVELFIFKFLSDLGVLKETYSFEYLIKMYEKHTPEEVLEHYARISRKKIINLFPKGDDGTTIINGTIFVNSEGEPVESQATLFKTSLMKYHRFGSLRNIKKEFKTKLFETFLKQSQDKSRLGQFFTPRKVVQAIVDMAEVEKLKPGARVCDPFCGVGGFIVEHLHNSNIKKQFTPNSNKRITPSITFHGFDKGTDHDEERTIILAKANMLIYLSDIIEKNPNLTKEYAKLFNETFHLITSNLGTFEKIIENEDEKYDLIMTNPPYITSGSASLKEELRTHGLDKHYPIMGKGVESLALEWIVNTLKIVNKEGWAYIVVPDSIFNTLQNIKIREFIKKECFIYGIISLPVKTFFNTPKKTYILIIKKKEDKNEVQDFPVFTYLVSNIGETLDIDRFEIEGESDLDKAKKLFKIFKKDPKSFGEYLKSVSDLRCKLIPIDELNPNDFWIIENWWSEEEKKELGLKEEEVELTVDEFSDKIKELNDVVASIYEEIDSLKSIKKKIKNYKFKEVYVDELFDLSITTNRSWFTKSYVNEHKGDIPVYGASKDPNSVYGYIKDNLPNVKYFENCLTWNIDGSVGVVHYRKGRFSLSEKVIPLIFQEKYINNIYPNYIKYQLELEALKYGFDYSNKAGKNKLKNIKIAIPITENGEFDLEAQKEIAQTYAKIEKIIGKLNKFKREFKNIMVHIEPNCKVKKISVKELFNIKKGSSKYTKEYIRNNPGRYPVYSSQTTNEGIIGYINTYDYDDEECLTWTTDGIYAGTVFYRTGKFSMTTHCGALLLKEELKDNIDLKYIAFYLNNSLKNYAVGEDNKRVTVKIIKEVPIEIPIDENGNFDLQKQREIAEKYMQIEKIKSKLISHLDDILKSKVVL